MFHSLAEFLRDRHVRFLLAGLAIALVSLTSTNERAFGWQDDAPTEEKEPVEDSTFSAQKETLKQLLKVSSDRARQMAEAEEAFNKTSKDLAATEQVIARIQDQGIQKQMQAMNSAMAAMQMNNMMIMNTAGLTNVGNNSSGNSANNNNGSQPITVDLINNQLFLQRQQALASYDAMMKSQEAQQLSGEMRNALAKRLEIFQKAVQYREDYMKMYEESLVDFEEFWTLLDMEGYRSVEQNTELLSMLQADGDGCAAAQLLQCMISLRLGKNADALRCLENAQKLDPFHESIWTMQRSLVHWQMDDTKKSRMDAQAARKADGKNPKIQQLTALLQADQGEWSNSQATTGSMAKKGVEKLTNHRLFVLASTLRTKKSTNKDLVELQKHVDQAIKLTGEDDWLSQVAQAIVWAAGGKKEEAIAAMEKAIELANGSNITRCKEIQKRIEDDQPIQWEFLGT